MAWALLALTAVNASCLVPDLEFAENNPPFLDESLITGEAVPYQQLTWICTEGNEDPDSFDLDLSEAVGDPDGDELYFSWYVNLEPGADTVANPDRLNVSEFTVRCSDSFVRAGFNTVDVYVMDRPQLGLNSDDAQSTTGDGFVLHILYIFDVTK